MSNKRIRLNPSIMRPPPLVKTRDGYTIDGRAWAKLMQELANAADLTEDIDAGTGNNYVLARYVRLAASSLPTVSDTATTSRDTGFKVHSSASYKTTANGRCYFGASATDYIHTIPASQSWIISAYVKGGNPSLSGKLGVKTANGTYTTAITTSAVAGTTTRVSGVLDLESDAATTCVVFIDNDETAENIWFADLMLEPREGTDTEASPFAFPSPGLAEDVVIDGSHIRLGQTDFDTGTGFWIGDDSGTPKLSLGTSSNGITWNGSTFEVRGTSVAGSFVVTTGGNVRMGMTDWNVGTGFWLGDDGGTAKFAIGDSGGLLKEDGDYILLETGDLLLLESAQKFYWDGSDLQVFGTIGGTFEGDLDAAGGTFDGEVTGTVGSGASVDDDSLSANVAIIETGSFTGTLTGFSSNPSGTIRYVKQGKIVTLSSESAINGTSNTTDMGMTGIPAAAAPSKVIRVACIIQDQGGDWAGAFVYDGTTAIFDAPDHSTPVYDLEFNHFTASGTKGIPPGWTVTYPID